MADAALDKKLTVQDEVCNSLMRMESQFKMALPSQIPSERFIRVAQTAIRNNPDLVALKRPSLYAAFHKCAADGLLPDGREAAIVPFGDEAVYMPMVQGICKKARNSGEIKTMNAKVVYEKDYWESWADELGEHFKHVEADGERGKPRLTYAYAITTDGGFYLEVVSEKQMESIEAQSRQKSGPWKGPFKDEMRRKSAIRRLGKYRLPSSTDLEDIIRRDDEMYDVDKAAPKTAQPTSSRLSKVVETTATTEPAPPDEKQDGKKTGEDDIPFGN